MMELGYIVKIQLYILYTELISLPMARHLCMTREEEESNLAHACKTIYPKHKKQLKGEVGMAG